MSTLLYTPFRGDTPSEQQLVRATTEPVDNDAPPEMERDVPEFNEVERAETQHAGLATSNLASHWTDSAQTAPFWSGQANVSPSFQRINAPQSSAGYAASLEAGGQFGHGTMPYAIGIEPTIRDGAVFGLDYFAAEQPGIQPYAGNYMELAPGYDRDVTGAAMGRAALTSHQAAQSGYVSQWSGAMQPGARHG